jgi:N-dimethylarginine dimethylaminohydrolase
MTENQRLEQYSLHYARLKKDTLKRLYRNFKHTQSNFARIDEQEIRALSDTVKKEMLRVLSLIEEVISILQDETQATP